MMKTKALFVEKRADGKFAVRRKDSKRASKIAKTQKVAIKKAMKLEPDSKPRVERVRKVSKSKKRAVGEWRAVKSKPVRKHKKKPGFLATLFV